jgi:uroporphyrinogen-III synthase
VSQKAGKTAPRARDASPAGSLAGKTILVTRPEARADRLVEMLEGRGSRVIRAPTIELRPVRSAALSAALRDLERGRFAWVVLTSPATVGMLADRLEEPAKVRARVAAIGDGTADAFARWATRRPDLRPRAFTTTALARAFPRGEGRVLCARADVAPEGLEETLAAKGWKATRVDAYHTIFPKALPEEARRALTRAEVDAITFTSASTVRGYADATRAIERDLPSKRPAFVCIGPVTAREAREHGLRVRAVASPHTTDGLVEALERASNRRAERPR